MQFLHIIIFRHEFLLDYCQIYIDVCSRNTFKNHPRINEEILPRIPPRLSLIFLWIFLWRFFQATLLRHTYTGLLLKIFPEMLSEIISESSARIPAKTSPGILKILGFFSDFFQFYYLEIFHFFFILQRFLRKYFQGFFQEFLEKFLMKLN